MSELYKLPDGWILEKFDEIKLTNTIGLVKNQQEQNPSYPYKYIKMNNITNDNGFTFHNIVSVEATKEELNKFSLSKGDFLFNTRNSYELVGKTCIYNHDLDEIVLYNNNIMRVRFKENINPYYIGYQFSSNFIHLQLNDIKSGTTNVSAIYYKTLKDIDIIIPPLSEQQRIVSKLDLLFEKIDKSIALHQKNMDEANVFMGSVLNDVFEELEEKYIKEKFDEIKISNIIGLVKNAKEQSASLPYQYVKMNNITNDNRFTFDNIINVDATDDEVKKFNLKKGDFLFNTRNSVELVGKSCIFDYDMDDILYNNNIMRVRFRNDILSYFISYQFGCGFLKDQLENIKSATTSVAAIYYKTLKEIDIIIPPLNIQQKTVKYLDEISEKIEKVKQVQKEKMVSLKALKTSILDRAFRGEL